MHSIYGQGYLFSRPVAVDVLQALLSGDAPLPQDDTVAQSPNS